MPWRPSCCCCQWLSHVWLFATPWTAARQAPLSSTISRSLLKFTPIESVMPLTISSSAPHFFFCLQSFPAWGSFSMSWLSASGGQSIGASASASVLSTNIQDSFSLRWTGLISLQFKGFSESSPTPLFKNITTSALSLLNSPTLTSIHDYWKNNSFD